MENKEQYLKRVEYINWLRCDLEAEINSLFDEIQSSLTETVMLEEPVMVQEFNDFDNQLYTTTIFGIAKDEIISAVGDITHLTFDEADKGDLTETMFDYITFQDKIYLLKHIIDNLK